MTSYPANIIRRAWNVIEGEQNDVSIFVFDSVVGEVKGTYCTFVAFRRESWGESLRNGEKLAQDSGWTAIYRLRFWQVPWTLSTGRIEALLRNTLN